MYGVEKEATKVEDIKPLFAKHTLLQIRKNKLKIPSTISNGSFRIVNLQGQVLFKKFVRGEDIPDIAEQVNLMNQAKLTAVEGTPVPGAPATTTPQSPTPQDTTKVPTVPQGTNRGIVGAIAGGVKKIFGGQ